MYTPIMFVGQLGYMYIKPACTELPRSLVAVCALEVGTAVLILRRYIPAATSFIGYEWSIP